MKIINKEETINEINEIIEPTVEIEEEIEHIAFNTPQLAPIRIMDNVIPVEINDQECDNNSAGAFFEIKSNGTRIVMRSQYTDYQTYLTALMHEMTHAVFYGIGTQLELQFEEVLTHTISSTLARLSLTFQEIYEGIPTSGLQEDMREAFLK